MEVAGFGLVSVGILYAVRTRSQSWSRHAKVVNTRQAMRLKEEDHFRQPTFHSKLKVDWPEPHVQLHAGGWAFTERLGSFIRPILKNSSSDKPTALDLCCGEGATANYFAKKHGWNVVGLDISKSAIDVAKLDKLATFVVGSAYDMPFQDESFDVVYGQDPDALGSEEFRIDAFKECFRVLKPNGVLIFHHHWIPGTNWSTKDLEEFYQMLGSKCGSADDYKRDLRLAGFKIIYEEDIHDIGSKHLLNTAKLQQKRTGEKALKEPWLRASIEFINRGNRFGIFVTCETMKNQANAQTS